MSSLPASEIPAVETRPVARAAFAHTSEARDPITVLIVVPSLDAGAADAGAVDLTRLLTAAGHRAIVASRPGRLVADVTAAGGEFVAARSRQQQSDRDAAQRRRADPHRA